MNPKIVRKLSHKRSKPLLLLDTSDSSNEEEGEYKEDEETYDTQEAFDDLFIHSVKLEKKKKQLKRKIMELNKKLKSFKDTISTLQQNSSTESDKDNELSKKIYLLLCAKEEMSLKIVEFEKKLNEAKLFLNLEKDNKKHKKRRLLENNQKLSNKVIELEERLKNMGEERNESHSDNSLIQEFED